MPKLLKVANVAEMLGLCQYTIYDWVSDGRIESVRLGRTIRIAPAALERFTNGAIRAESVTPRAA